VNELGLSALQEPMHFQCIVVQYNPLNNKASALPRHTEIVDVLAKKICKDLEIPSFR